MPSTIKPTIGRKVWFWDAAPAVSSHNELAYDATVIMVWGGDQYVNLRVTDHHGNTRVESSVELRDPQSAFSDMPDQHGRERYATWMPYQVGQAKA